MNNCIYTHIICIYIFIYIYIPLGFPNMLFKPLAEVQKRPSKLSASPGLAA